MFSIFWTFSEIPYGVYYHFKEIQLVHDEKIMLYFDPAFSEKGVDANVLKAFWTVVKSLKFLLTGWNFWSIISCECDDRS